MGAYEQAHLVLEGGIEVSIEERRRIAGATSPCPAKVPVSQARSGGRGNSRDYHIKDCQVCKGTGKVFALAGVRELCPSLILLPGLHDEGCPECHGLGWVASDNAWAWLDVPRQLGWPRVSFTRYEDRTLCRIEKMLGLNYLVGKGQDDEEALLDAIVQALIAAGATLLEVKDGS